MASTGGSFIRVRICFDYPPPSAFGHRMCWLLVDMNTCRMVADLESMIREKFDLSRGSILSLFIEDHYLPHTESVHVVRDNDSVRVKVDWLTQGNGHSSCPDSSSIKQRKRKTITKDGQAESEVCAQKKRKKSVEEADEMTALEDNGNVKSVEKCIKKKKKNKVEKMRLSLSPNPAASSTHIPAPVDPKSKKSERASISLAARQNAFCRSSSLSLNDEDNFPQKTANETAIDTASIVTTHSKPVRTKSHSALSLALEPNHSAEKSTGLKSKCLPLPQSNSKSLPMTVVQQGHRGQAAGIKETPQNDDTQWCDPDCEDMWQVSHGDGSQSSWQADIVRKKWHVLGKREVGKGRRVDRGQHHIFESSDSEAKELPNKNESQASTSATIENSAKTTPQQDYSSMPLLAAPPQVGQKIAFKLLELTENYTPAVSEYKEGKIVSFNPITRQIELEVSNAFRAPSEPGKFDLVYHNPDGTERVEYAVSRDSQLIERWETLLEPRLIIGT